MKPTDWMTKVTKEEYDIIKRVLIDNTNGSITITDDDRVAHFLIEDAYEEE